MKTPIPHGTPRGAFSHYWREEKLCEACRLSYNEYGKAQYRRTHPYPNTAVRIIADHLETFGSMTIQELVWLIQRRHDIKDETVRRAVHRMIADGRLVSVKDIEGKLIVEVNDG